MCHKGYYGFVGIYGIKFCEVYCFKGACFTYFSYFTMLIYTIQSTLAIFYGGGQFFYRNFLRCIEDEGEELIKLYDDITSDYLILKKIS